MNQPIIRSYVALGDSLSEGLGDEGFETERLHRGWADRLAQLLSLEAQLAGASFEYANLALRGSKTRSIMTSQLEAALRQKPDLVTVMAGSNDIFASPKELTEVERILRHGLNRLSSAGIRVLVVNTADPQHLRLAKHLRPKSKRMTQLINRVCAELSLDVVDIHGAAQLSDIRYWCSDMAHFSRHGHTFIANLVASSLKLSHRHLQSEPKDMAYPDRGPKATLIWVKRDVVPFLIRRVRGRSSGDGLRSKLPNLTLFALPASGVELVRLGTEAKTQSRIPTQTIQS